MKIVILGSGCPKCKLLEEKAKQAVEELGLHDKVQIEHIYEVDKIVELGITFTPALLINDKLQSEGRLLDVEEIKNLINKHLNA